MASKNGQGRVRVQRGVISYSPRPLSACLSLCVCVCVCVSYHTKVAVGLFKSKSSTHFPAQFLNTPNTRMPPPRRPWATRPIHARCPKRLPLVLGAVGAEGVCFKSKLPTTHNHHQRRRRRRRHHHHLFQLLLKVFIVALAIFKRLNPGATEDGAEGVLVLRRHLPAPEPMRRLPFGDR